MSKYVKESNARMECDCNVEIEDDSAKTLSEITILKLLAGITLATMKQHWIASTVVILVMILFIVIFGFWFTILVLICSILIFLYQLSDRIVYWPNSPSDSRTNVRLPLSFGLPSENLFVYTKDGEKLHIILMKQPPDVMKTAVTIIYLHGNAGNIGHRIPNAYDLHRLLGVNVLLVEYRGFGLSTGIPSESGLYEDARTALSYIQMRPDIDKSKIVLFGRSLGGAVAIECASNSDIRSRIGALIVENTFTSIPDMAKNIFRDAHSISSLPTWCHKNKFGSKFKMCRVVTPTLLLSGLSDSLVPHSMMLELYHACAAPMKLLYQFKNGNHNDTWKCKGYYLAIRDLIDEVFHHRVCIKNNLPPGVTCIAEPQIL